MICSPLFTGLAPLPPVREIHLADYSGINEKSFWLVKDLILAGALPEHDNDIKELLDAGFETFVSLHDMSHHYGKRIKNERPLPYNQRVNNFNKDGKEIKFLQFTIPNFSVASDPRALLKFIYDQIFPRIAKREKIYLHCSDGQGRTCLVSTVIIGLLYNLSSGDSLDYITKFHHARKIGGDFNVPETLEQKMQIYNILDKLVKEIPPPSSSNYSETDIPNYQNTVSDHELETKLQDEIAHNISNEAMTDIMQDESNSAVLYQCNSADEITRIPTSNDSMEGPTSYSNWVIPNSVLIGPFPLDITHTSLNKERVRVPDSQGKAPLFSIIDAGINCFISLQQELPVMNYISNSGGIEYKNLGAMGGNHRSFFKNRGVYCHYVDVLEELHKEQPDRKFTFIHFPIEAGTAGNEAGLIDLLQNELVPRVKRGEKIYVHDTNGHSRVGIIGASLLGILYNLGGSEALNLNQTFHNMRKNTQGITDSPVEFSQKMIVQSVVKKINQPTTRSSMRASMYN
jgi:protein-tyrosine phosphatase